MDDKLYKAMQHANSPEGRREQEARIKDENARRDAKLAAVAERLLGVRPEHADPIYTQQPMMAGVLREALRQAWDAGAMEVSESFMKAILKGKDEGRGG